MMAESNKSYEARKEYRDVMAKAKVDEIREELRVLKILRKLLNEWRLFNGNDNK